MKLTKNKRDNEFIDGNTVVLYNKFITDVNLFNNEVVYLSRDER